MHQHTRSWLVYRNCKLSSIAVGNCDTQHITITNCLCHIAHRSRYRASDIIVSTLRICRFQPQNCSLPVEILNFMSMIRRATHRTFPRRASCHETDTNKQNVAHRFDTAISSVFESDTILLPSSLSSIDFKKILQISS